MRSLPLLRVSEHVSFSHDSQDRGAESSSDAVRIRRRLEELSMPLTLSHPAAVLPLLRRPFVPVALIAGAMVPDLPYFLDIPVTAQSWYEPLVNATFSHSAPGLLLVGVPLVVVIASLCLLSKAPIRDLLPLRLHMIGHGIWRRRRPPSFCAWFLISALIGLATHIVWDSLTGSGSWAVAHLPFFHADLTTGHLINRALQHGSTILGAVIIVIWIVRRIRQREISIEWLPVSKRWVAPRVAVIGSIVLISAVFAAVAVGQTHDREGSIGLEHALSLSFTSGMGAAVLATIVYSALWHIVRQVSPPKPPHGISPSSALGENRVEEN